MKRIIERIAVGIGLLLLSVSSAEANAFLSIQVGTSTVTCNNSLTFSVTNCSVAAGFVTTANSAVIQFSGIVGGVQFGEPVGEAFTQFGLDLTGTQSPFRTVTVGLLGVTSIRNNTGMTQSIIIGFAENGFPPTPGPDVSFSASQQLSRRFDSPPNATQTFLGFIDSTGSLFPGTGLTSNTGTCTTTSVFPCIASGPATPLVISAPFALNGLDVISIPNSAQLLIFNVSASAIPQVPEPSSAILYGTGLLLLLGYRRLKRKITAEK